MHNRKWIGDKLWFLLNYKTTQLRELFPEYAWDTLKSKRKKYRSKIREGEEATPQRPYWLTDDMTMVSIRARLSEIDSSRTSEDTVEQVITEESRLRLHENLDEIINEANFNPNNIKGFKINAGEYEQGSKHPETGEVTVTKLRKNSVTIIAEPKDFKPKWPPVTRVESITLPKSKAVVKTDAKRAVIIPDIQVPFQDEKALSILYQIMDDIKPDKIIFLGDLLDLSAWSSFVQLPEFASATQPAIQQAHQILAAMRKSFPHAEITVLEGNHEERLPRYLLKNTPAAFGLKRADQLEGAPVISVPNLCAFDTLDVEYVAGYPGNKVWINKRLKIIHGSKANSNTNESKTIVHDERATVVFGHTHRISSYYKTVEVYEGGRTNAAYNPGCLCLLSGHVPSVKSGTDIDGGNVENYENWQHGFGIVDYEDGDKPFYYQQVYINTFQDYQTRYNGKTYMPLKAA